MNTDTIIFRIYIIILKHVFYLNKISMFYTVRIPCSYYIFPLIYYYEAKKIKIFLTAEY